MTKDCKLKLDRINEMSYQIDECKQYLIDYRAHLALKLEENKGNAAVRDNLQEDEAEVICDWKMKLLSCYYRENQQLFFAKRGTSCIGFMVITNSTSSDQKKVHFYFMFTDDTTQNANSVLSAKAYLYNELLPDHIKFVHFRSDGAGCYSSNLTKAAMTEWGRWTKGKIIEKSYRVSVAGDGKTNLDGLFGRLYLIYYGKKSIC